MSLIARARQILRSQGVSGLLRRAMSKSRRYAVARIQAKAREQAWAELVSRTRNGPVFFPRHAYPLVSIIVSARNQQSLATCLNSLLRELDSLPCEVIVVDDSASASLYLDSCSGLQSVRNQTPQGFARSANSAVALARGRYLHFLSGDTIVTPHWLGPLLRLFDSTESIGAVGSQLRNPDGSISDAGGIIWRDGSAQAYGAAVPASDPGVAYPRSADYCSATSLMVRADAFREVGGFDAEFDLATYADVDLCFRLRDLGHRVLYQPESVVVKTPETPAPASVRERFQSRWANRLSFHYPPDEELIERASRRVSAARVVLVMDSFVPFADRSAGARRIFEVMRIMRDLDWHVIFVADEGGSYEPYTSRLRRAGVEVRPHRGSAEGTIRSLPIPVDVAWISRPDVLQKYLPALHALTSAAIIYDTVDLHFLRRQREEQVTAVQTNWEALRSIELSLARRVDHVVVTSPAEQVLLRDEGIAATVVPIIETPLRSLSGYEARRDILFLGNYTHEPNVDAALLLANTVMPRVWERMPDARLILAGADPTPAIARLQDERILVPGHIPDIRQVFERVRVFAAPIRFGAGVKGKIVQSLAYGLPVITTVIGAEGIGIVDGEHAIVCDDIDAFIGATIRLYNDEVLWKALSARGLELAQKFSVDNVKPSVDVVLSGTFERKVKRVGIDVGLASNAAQEIVKRL